MASLKGLAHSLHWPGSITTVWSGSSTSDRDTEDAPGCLAGLRPDRPRDERFFVGFFAHGASENGGREEFDESDDRRRSNSAIRSVWAATTDLNSASSARISSRDIPLGQSWDRHAKIISKSGATPRAPIGHSAHR
jgi:hypothetical protein